MSDILALDQWLESFLFSVRIPFFLRVGEIVSLFGNVATVLLIACIIGICLTLFKRPYPSLVGLTSTLLGTGVSVYLLKILVARPRPGGSIPSIIESSYSFPSGHAAGSMALYGFIAFLLFRAYPRHKKLIGVVVAGIILSIGFSRLYLGVHFLSDVLAGYVLGGLWLFIGIKITKRVEGVHTDRTPLIR